MYSYIPLAATCPRCEGGLVISVELIESLLQCSEPDEEAALDDLIQQSLRGGHSYTPIEFPSPPFPVALDPENHAIVFLGWCKRCKKMAIVSISEEQLHELLNGGDN